jgi:hypothetical protein
MRRGRACKTLTDLDGRRLPSALRLGGRMDIPLQPTPDLLRDGISCRLVAFHCRKSFAACCLPRHSGFLSFVFRPVGNDRTDELVQKVYRVAHGL